jgi:uncharacterized repeat protein (TIGR01451 family)
MKSVRLLVVSLLLIAATQFAQSANLAAPTATVKTFGHIPLSFEPNRGQTNPQARFVAHGQGYSLFLTPSEAVLSLQSLQKEDVLHHPIKDDNPISAVLRLQLLNANTSPAISGQDKLPGYSNYLIGKDESKWVTRIPQYGKVEYSQIYPGIDLLYYGNQRQLEYDFVVAPGADPNAIAFQVQGTDKVELGARGQLTMHLQKTALELQKPVVYQQVNGERRQVAANYILQGDGRVSFALGTYDSTLPLVIDPILTYSSYLGGSGNDSASAVAVDSTGSAYITGQTASVDFPSAGAYQPTNRGLNAFLTKMSTDGTAVVFSTYLGGTDTTCGGDRGNSVALNAINEPFVAGRAFSTDFPVTFKGYQRTGGGCNGSGVGGSGFVTHFAADGTTLKWSTYLGGQANLPTNILSIAISASSNNAYVTGYDQSGTLATAGTFQTTLDAAGDQGAFVSEFTTDGAHLLFSTYVRATTSGSVIGNSIALDRNGNSYITGAAQTTSLPLTPGAFQKTFGGGLSDAFVTKVNTIGTQLIYSSYLGGSDTTQMEYGSQIVVEFTFGAYVVGTTGSTNFPTTLGSLQPTYPGGATNAFVARVASDGTRLNFSTFLGGSQGSTGVGIGIYPILVNGKLQTCKSPCNLVVYGNTTSTNFPTHNPMQSTGDLFLTTLDGFGVTIPGYSTLLGSPSGDTATGLATDANIRAYITGTTTSLSYPTTAGALETSYAGGGSDGFISKVAMSSDLVVTQTASPVPAITGQNLTYTITITDNGPDNGVSLAFSNAVPAGTTFVSITPSAGTCNPPPGQTGAAHCTLPSLNSATGQNTWTITWVLNVTATSGQVIKNRASVTALSPDPNTVNNVNTLNVKVQ